MAVEGGDGSGRALPRPEPHPNGEGLASLPSVGSGEVREWGPHDLGPKSCTSPLT